MEILTRNPTLTFETDTTVRDKRKKGRRIETDFKNFSYCSRSMVDSSTGLEERGKMIGNGYSENCCCKLPDVIKLLVLKHV